MSSSAVAAGRELVKKWAAACAEIQVSFRVNGVAGATFTGKIDGFDDSRLSVGGDKGRAFVDLSYVENARDVLTEEALIRSGLSPESYGECVTFSLPLGCEVTFVCLPRLRPSDESN